MWRPRRIGRRSTRGGEDGSFDLLQVEPGGSSGWGLRSGLPAYLLDFPLWWDEAFVAVNFLRRGYLDLLRPLDYGQVCPLLFLWAELTAVRWSGFSEWSLRLFPLACAVASVVLFRVAAGQVCGGGRCCWRWRSSRSRSTRSATPRTSSLMPRTSSPRWCS